MRALIVRAMVPKPARTAGIEAAKMIGVIVIGGVLSLRKYPTQGSGRSGADPPEPEQAPPEPEESHHLEQQPPQIVDPEPGFEEREHNP